MCTAQNHSYTTASILSHNDYEQPVPFVNAYNHRVGFIEADVFLHNDNLLVAHTRLQVSNDRTLAGMYLSPIRDRIAANSGKAYPDGSVLTLMIDLKTEGHAALTTLIKVLEEDYPTLTACSTFRIVISGDVPAKEQWNQYPTYISFDGRPSLTYSDSDLKRVAYISDAFGNYAAWNNGKVSEKDLSNVRSVIAKVHQLNKPFRFWGIPDSTGAWQFLIQEKVDIVGTDHVSDLVKFLK